MRATWQLLLTQVAAIHHTLKLIKFVLIFLLNLLTIHVGTGVYTLTKYWGILTGFCPTRYSKNITNWCHSRIFIPAHSLTSWWCRWSQMRVSNSHQPHTHILTSPLGLIEPSNVHILHHTYVRKLGLFVNTHSSTIILVTLFSDSTNVQIFQLPTMSYLLSKSLPKLANLQLLVLKLIGNHYTRK